MTVVRTAYVVVEDTELHPVEVIVTETDGVVEYGWQCTPCGKRAFNMGHHLPNDKPVNGVLPRWTLVEDAARRHSRRMAREEPFR